MIDHVSVAVSDVARSAAFYDAILRPLGHGRLVEQADTVGFGKRYPEFWINLRSSFDPDAEYSGAHVCLRAPDEAAVKAFYEAAMAHGGQDDGAPGLRSIYAPNYYAAFVIDPDGNRIEAVTFLQGRGD